MLARMLSLSFLSIISLALAVNAYKHHLQHGVKKNHHELAAAAANVQCPRTRIRSSSAANSVTRSAPVQLGAPVAAASSSASKFVTSVIGRPSAVSDGPLPSQSIPVVSPPSPSQPSPSAPDSFPSPSSSLAAPLSSASFPSFSSVITQMITRGSAATTAAPVAPTPQAPAIDDKVEAASASTPLTPNGIKAGIAGGDAYPYVKDHIGWWYDWSPTPSKAGKPIAVPMLWGGGTADATDAARLSAFKQLKTVPLYVLGFEEPDCAPGSGSAGMTVDAAVKEWESLMAPLKAKGALLGSPSMCKQADETWLSEFSKKIKTPWDITAIHINKNNLDGVKKDIDHYSAYKKPIWVTEFACVADNPSFVPCTNQAQINTFIQDIVRFFESNSAIYAYAYSNGLGLGNVWPMTTSDGKLSASGKTYLDAISKYH